MEQEQQKQRHNKDIGAKGELVAANYYKRKGFNVLEMNYLRKWGEIDVIVEKDNKVTFVEVKTVSYGTKADLERSVTHGTWRPEENVHAFKIKKLSRAIDSWIADNKWAGDWQIDVAAIRLVPRETYATIKIIDNVILG